MERKNPWSRQEITERCRCVHGLKPPASYILSISHLSTTLTTTYYYHPHRPHISCIPRARCISSRLLFFLSCRFLPRRILGTRDVLELVDIHFLFYMACTYTFAWVAFTSAFLSVCCLYLLLAPSEVLRCPGYVRCLSLLQPVTRQRMTPHALALPCLGFLHILHFWTGFLASQDRCLPTSM